MKAAVSSASWPSHIGKYGILRELGRGTSATVYLAHDPFGERRVAIKQIHAYLLNEPGQAQRNRRLLHNEVRLIGKLHHPHIVALLDADEQAEPPYLVLEYIDGPSLVAFTAADRLLPVAQVLDLIFKCCHALDYAQRQGLVHRDIKPANLLLGSNGVLKVTDFGTALSMGSNETQLSGLVGSPAYMSPEQIREEWLTPQSDMFSLGVVMYELLSGRKPFEGDSEYATIYKIHHEQATPLSLLRPGLPAAIDALMERALAKGADDRFASWHDFGQALLTVHRTMPRLPAQRSEGEQFSQLRALPFFAGFSDVALWETLRLGQWQHVGRGVVLMREGEPGDVFYLLLRGQVVVSRSGRTLTTLGVGVSIGEMVYLQPGSGVRAATVTAQTELELLTIHGAALRQASSELQTRFDKAFIRILVERLIATNQRLVEWDLPSPAAR